MIPQPAIRSVQLVGGPEDGLTIERCCVHAPGEDWPQELRITRVIGTVRIDVYLRCSWGRYKYKETR